MRSFNMAILCAALVGCSGGGMLPDMGGMGMSPDLANGNMVGSRDMTVAAPGTLAISAMPMLPGMKVSVFVDQQMPVVMPTGAKATEIMVAAGTHDVRLTAPGYGYAVAGYAWDSSSQPVDQWTIQGLAIASTTKVEVKAILCRDLSGKWMTVDGPRDVSIASTKNGTCNTIGFSPFQFTVQGDSLTVGGNGACIGVRAQILNNGRQIEVDCGMGETYSFTKQ